MVYYVIGLIVTFAIGAFFGVAMMCCFHMASEADRHIEENQKKKQADNEENRQSAFFMEVITMDWRKNAGYIITDSMTIGESEIVLGVHETEPNMFVTWECNNKTNYYWGHYSTDLLAAQKDFCERALDKIRFYEQNKVKKKSEPER